MLNTDTFLKDQFVEVRDRFVKDRMLSSLFLSFARTKIADDEFMLPFLTYEEAQDFVEAYKIFGKRVHLDRNFT